MTSSLDLLSLAVCAQSSYPNTCQSGLDWWEGGSARPERWGISLKQNKQNPTATLNELSSTKELCVLSALIMAEWSGQLAFHCQIVHQFQKTPGQQLCGGLDPTWHPAEIISNQQMHCCFFQRCIMDGALHTLSIPAVCLEFLQISFISVSVVCPYGQNPYTDSYLK